MRDRCSADDDRLHDDRRHRPVAHRLVGRRRADRLDDVHALDHLAEDGVLRRRARVEVVEEVVADEVDEDLRAAGVGLARVRHRERAGVVGDLGDQLVGDAATPVALDRRAVSQRERGARRRPAGARDRRHRVLAVGAAELAHEPGDDAVEAEPVVEARLREVGEVARRDGQLVRVQLGGEVAHAGLEGRHGVRHRRGREVAARHLERVPAREARRRRAEGEDRGGKSCDHDFEERAARKER